MSFLKLLEQLQKENPEITFQKSNQFSWNLEHKKIRYINPSTHQEESASSSKLLHELAHAKLDHHNYRSDLELLKIESSAWSLTKKLCQEYGVKLDPDEQSEALQSYINWASSRSQCPSCKQNGLQTKQTEFLCPNCKDRWKVSTSRFTRTYRKT